MIDKNFQILMTKINQEIQGVEQTPDRINKENHTSYIIIKLMKTNDREKYLKRSQVKKNRC